MVYKSPFLRIILHTLGNKRIYSHNRPRYIGNAGGEWAGMVEVDFAREINNSLLSIAKKTIGACSCAMYIRLLLDLPTG